LDIEHVADGEPENPVPYWHVQELVVSELALTVARGLRANLGAEIQVPLRVVRDRVHYLDLARMPYLPPNPDTHHRNETLTGVADPQAGLCLGGEWSPWTLAARAGVSVPVGRAEPDPFALGRLGLRHQHIQFGTGTWDPVLGLTVGRPGGPVGVELGGIARLALAKNDRGYRAGNRYGLHLRASPRLGAGWSVDVGLALAREETERWGGHVEEEGNLGRTDLLLSLGGGRVVAPLGALSLRVQVPLASETTGDQVKIPVIVTLAWRD
jgi:hypothetical protein